MKKPLSDSYLLNELFIGLSPTRCTGSCEYRLLENMKVLVEKVCFTIPEYDCPS